MPPGSIEAIIERLLDEVLDRRLRPVLAELAELRAAAGSAADPAEGYLTPAEAAHLLKVRAQTVNRWIRSGKLEAEGHSRARRVTRKAIERFMAARSRTSSEPDLDSLADAALRRRNR